MLTLKFLQFIWQMLKEDKSFQVGMIAGAVGIVGAIGWFIFFPALVIDLSILLIVTVNRITKAILSKLAEQRARELRIQREAEEADRFHKAQELARIEANSLENQQKRAAAIAALEPASNQIRRFWAKHHLILNEVCPLRLLNEEIQASVSEASPFESLQQLAALKETLIRKVVRFETEQLYEKWYEYISEAVPRDEFDRLMHEAEEQSRTADEYGRRLIELGEFLSEAAGPAAVKLHKKRETDRVADYEAMFADDAENPFDETEEDRSASRVG